MPILELLTAESSLQFFDWLRGKYGDDVVSKLEKSYKDFNWTTASGNYQRKIEKDFNQTRLFGSDSPIKLNEIFIDVYLLNNSDAFEYHQKLDNDQKFPANKRVNGFDFVKGGDKFIFILGKPGSGKTTFLKHIAVKASKGEIEGIPVFVSLKDWARSHYKLLDYLVKEFSICKFPTPLKLIEYLLETGKIIVLFDGLDEVSEAREVRSKIIQQIKDFSRNYDENQFLITCRIAATDYTFQDFTYLRMADFTPSQINTYIKNWFKGKSKEKYRLFKKSLFDLRNERFLEMASQPLLLSLLCINFSETMTFSERRIDIYEEAIGVLIEKWSSFNDVIREEFIELSKPRKMQMFGEIAYKNFSKDKDFDRFQKKELIKQIVDFISRMPATPSKADIDGEKILQSMEANNSILIERYKNVYSFGHLSFQEYFTARYVSEKDVRIKQLLTPERIHQDRWREVILNTASFLSDADDFFEVFIDSINVVFSYSTNSSKELLNLLEQTNFKSRKIVSKRNIRSIRFFYLYLLLLEARSRYIDNNPKETRDTLNKIDYALSHIRYLNPDPDLDRALRHAFNFTRDYFRDLPQAINRSFIPHSDPDIAFDYQIFIFSFAITSFYFGFRFVPDVSSKIVILENFLQTAIEKATYLRDQPLVNNLKEIIPPTKMFNETEYLKIKRQVDSILRRRGLHTDISFLSSDFILNLNQYLIANSLLFECLNVASVSNRRLIEDKILSPFILKISKNF